MILSVSRRTDIPAFYMPWFMNRLREGYVMVRNPMNYHQVSRVSLSPEVIDCIVFWTKNTMPLTPHLGEIALQYPFYIQYTLNPYGRDLEPGLPPLAQRLASACAIAEQFGSKHVVWRYDPIMLTEQYTADWHIEQFAAMADALKEAWNTPDYQEFLKNACYLDRPGYADAEEFQQLIDEEYTTFEDYLKGAGLI